MLKDSGVARQRSSLTSFLGFENNCVKLNTDRTIPLQLPCSEGTLDAGNARVVAGVLYRKETSNDGGVARHVHVLRSHADVYSLYV